MLSSGFAGIIGIGGDRVDKELITTEQQQKNLDNCVMTWDKGQAAMMKKLKEYVIELQQNVPINEHDQPVGLINTGYLLSTGLLSPLEQLQKDPPVHMVLPISYGDGIPAIYGVPVWEIMEGERAQYFDLFKQYRALKYTNGIRSVYQLYLQTKVPVSILETLKGAYHWQARAQAFDIYKATQEQQQLEITRRKLEGKHFKVAEKLFDQCTDYISKNVQMLTPKTALEWTKLAVQLSRISVGLQPDSPQAVEGSPDRIQVNINNSNGNGGTHEIGQDAEDDKQRLTQILNVMQNIGILNQQPQTVDAEYEDVQESDEQDDATDS